MPGTFDFQKVLLRNKVLQDLPEVLEHAKTGNPKCLPKEDLLENFDFARDCFEMLKKEPVPNFDTDRV